jgi:hypothetical protein
MAPFFVAWNSRRSASWALKNKIGRVASDVLARSEGAMSLARSTAVKEKTIVCERRIHREALNIFLEVTADNHG